MLCFLWLSSVLDTVRLAPSTLTTMLSRLSNVAPSQSPSRHVTLPPRGSGRLWEQARRSGGTMTEASRDAEAHATLTTAAVDEPCHLPIPQTAHVEVVSWRGGSRASGFDRVESQVGERCPTRCSVRACPRLDARDEVDIRTPSVVVQPIEREPHVNQIGEVLSLDGV